MSESSETPKPYENPSLLKTIPPPLAEDRSTKEARFRSHEADADNPTPLSFKDALVHPEQYRNSDDTEMKEEWDLKLGDITLGDDGTMPTIKFSKRIQDKLIKPWQNSVVVKLLGRNIGLPGMAFHLYDKRILRKIGQLVGTVIKIDYHTALRERGKFARIAVRISLSQPLLSRFNMDGKIQKVEYEGLPIICYQCGKYGHNSIICQSNQSMNEANNGNSESIIPTNAAGEKDGAVDMNTEKSEKFGPWMIVARKRKPKFVVEKENTTAVERNQRSNIPVTSWFDALSEDLYTNNTVEQPHSTKTKEPSEGKDEGDIKSMEDYAGDPQFAFGNNADATMSDDDNSFVNETPEMCGEAELELCTVQNVIQSWVTAVYASPKLAGRRALWYHLNSIAESMHDPWIMGGDFNSILYAAEKRGGSALSTGICPNFNSWFHANNIVDLQFSGPRYTWTRGNLSKRLDRAMSNQEWILKFDNYSVTHLPRVESDHRPILSDQDLHRPYTVQGFFPRIDHNRLSILASSIDNKEIRQALFQMRPFKAPGIDGFPAGFYQTQCHIVGDSFCFGIKDIFKSHSVPSEVNKTLLVLIPKSEHSTSFKMYRPISLCTVFYKTVTKIIVNRLQVILPDLIGPHQISFVPGRHITENIIIAQEVVHSMRRKMGKKGFMAIKVDLEKAYDKLSWNFISETLTELALPLDLIRLIMECITSTSMNILWHGELTDDFSPSRGVRQDDLLLFAEATSGQAQCINSVLGDFCLSSGAKVNQSKTHVYFSKNVPNAVAMRIGRVSQQTYQGILDKMDQKLLGWAASQLSLAGRITLTQSVLQAVPIYVMQTTNLPGSIKTKLDQIFRRFLWSGNDDLRKMSLISWHNICQPKMAGGLGFKRLDIMNEALLLKVAWHLIIEPNKLCVQVQSTKYRVPPSEISHALPTRYGSHLWKSVGRVWDYAKRRLRWNVDDSWNWPKFSHILPHHVVMTFASIHPPSACNGVDQVYWAASPQGNFTVKSAYELLDHSRVQERDTYWRIAWSWKGPQSIKIFIWLVLHNRLKTRAGLASRRLNIDPSCERCGAGLENTIHVLCDCPYSRAVWLRLIRGNSQQHFFESSLAD
ncbi:reverse transcriptase domain-containing protein [Citrus sinensis]|nr:reverse transcriptase domain-containing protein [Citrus sinensis]